MSTQPVTITAGADPAVASLHASLREASDRAQRYRNHERDAKLEAERAEAAVSSIKQAIHALTSKGFVPNPVPATILATVNSASVERGSRMRWWPVVEAELQAMASRDEHPTMREFSKILLEKNPQSNLATIQAALYKMLNDNKLKRRLDKLYIPGTEPPLTAN